MKPTKLFVAKLRGVGDVSINCHSIQANATGVACYVEEEKKEFMDLVAFFPLGDLLGIYDDEAGEKKSAPIGRPISSAR